MSESEESEIFVDAMETPAFDDNIDSYPLHQAIFENQSIEHLEKILSTNKQEINRKDRHGNTPLHLAVMLGHEEQIYFLAANNASIKSKNINGWTALDEAVSYGDRKLIKFILLMGRRQTQQSMDRKLPELMETFKNIKDFQMELRWEFHSWLPLVKRFLPSDVCKIMKKGSSIRLDTTLLDFSDRRWERGDITFLFTCSGTSDSLMVIMDNTLKVYHNIRYSNLRFIDDDVDMLMSSDIISPEFNTKSITFQRAQAGWFFARYNKTEKIGNFNADFYNINGLTVKTKKRREHLSDEDVQSNKAQFELFKKSLDSNQEKIRKLSTKSGEDLSEFEEFINGDFNDEEMDELVEVESENFIEAVMSSTTTNENRKSLPPPVKTNVSWFEYINAPKGSPPCIGRPVKVKESRRTFKATVAMSKEFPLSIESLVNILDVITKLKHLKKLKEFVVLKKLPPGFPVRIDIPLIPAIMARVTFLNFAYNSNFDDHLFEIPPDYTEDSTRFPGI